MAPRHSKNTQPFHDRSSTMMLRPVLMHRGAAMSIGREQYWSHVVPLSKWLRASNGRLHTTPIKCTDEHSANRRPFPRASPPTSERREGRPVPMDTIGGILVRI